MSDIFTRLIGLRRNRRFLLGGVAFAILAALLAAALSVAVGGSVPSVRNDVLSQRTAPATAAPITLDQAWQIAKATERTWSGHWAIVDAHSADVGDRPTAQSGADGKRVTWEFDLAGGAVGTRAIQITNGTVVRTLQTSTAGKGPNGQTPIAPTGLSAPSVDSSQAVQIARSAKSITGSTQGAIGYHFEYIVDPSTRKPVIAVLAAHNSFPARVTVDAALAQVVGAVVQTFSGGDLQVSNDSGLHWHAVTIPGSAISVAATSAGVAFTAVLKSGRVEIFQSHDGGNTWAALASLPPGPTWVRGMAVGAHGGEQQLLVATPDGNWWASLATAAVSLDSTVPGQIQRLMTDSAGMLHAIIVTAPGQTSSFILRNGLWQAGVQGASRFVRNGGDVSAFSDAAGDAPIDAPPGTTSAVHLADGWLFTVNGIIESSTRGGLHRSTVQAIQVDSPGDGVALAERFQPAAILRSTDDGATWTSVLSLGGQAAGFVSFNGHSVVVVPTGGVSWVGF